MKPEQSPLSTKQGPQEMNAAIFRDMELLPAQAGSPTAVPGSADGHGLDGPRLTFAQSLDNARAKQSPAEHAGLERTAHTAARLSRAQSPTERPTASGSAAVPLDGEPLLHHDSAARQLADDIEPASTTATPPPHQTVALADPAAMPANTASPPSQIRPSNAVEAGLRAARAYDSGEPATMAVLSAPGAAVPPAPAAPGPQPEQPATGGAGTTAGPAAAPAQTPAVQTGLPSRPAAEPVPDASGPQEADLQVPADRGQVGSAATEPTQQVPAPAGRRFSPPPAAPPRDPGAQPAATIQEPVRAERSVSVAPAAVQTAPTPGRPTAAQSPQPPVPETGRDPAPAIAAAQSRRAQSQPAPVNPTVSSEPRGQSGGDRGPAVGPRLPAAATAETAAPTQAGPVPAPHTDPLRQSDVTQPPEQAPRTIPESTAPTTARRPSPEAAPPAHTASKPVVDGGPALRHTRAPAQVSIATDAARTGPATDARVAVSEPATPTPDEVRTAAAQEPRPAAGREMASTAPPSDPALSRPDPARTQPSAETRPGPAAGAPGAMPASETTAPTQATPPTQATQATQAADAARREAAAASRAPLSPQADVVQDTGAAGVRPNRPSAPEALRIIEAQQPRREAAAQAQAVQMTSGARPAGRGGGAWLSATGPQPGVAPSVAPAPVSEAAIHGAPIAEHVGSATAPSLTAQVATLGGRPTTSAEAAGRTAAAGAADVASLAPAVPRPAAMPGPVAEDVATGGQSPQTPPAEGLASRTTAASTASAAPQTVRLDGRAAAAPTAAAAATAEHNAREVGGPSRRPQQVQVQRTELEVSPVTGTDFAGVAAASAPAGRIQDIADGGLAQTQALARARRVVAEIAALDHTDRGELQIDLDWEDVGVRHLSVRVEEGRARLLFTCTNPESVAHLRSLEAPIRQALEAGGMQLDDFRAGYEGGQRQGDGRWAEQAQRQPDRAQVPLDAPADGARRTRPSSATLATHSRGPRTVEGRLDVLV